MPRTILALTFSVGCVLAFTGLKSLGQQFQPKFIVFKGAPEYSDDELLAAAGLKKGAILTVAEMKDHFERLRDSGVFENVLYKFDGETLAFQLSPSSQLYSLRIANLPLVTGKDLDEKLHAKLPLYHGKVPSEGGLLEDVRRELENMLAGQGIHTSLKVLPYGTPGTSEVKAMSFSEDSPPVVIGKIRIEGVSPEFEEKVKAVAGQTVGTAFDTENSARNVEIAFESFYVDQGFASVKVHAERLPEPTVTEQQVAVPFTVTIQEGRVYKLGAVQLSSYSVISQAELDKAVATFNQAQTRLKGLTLRHIWSYVASQYKAHGYLDCQVVPHAEFVETTGTANYTVEIDPGPVYRLGFVKFDNVSDDLRKHLMRSWQMLPGDVFDEGYVANFVNNAQHSDPALMRSLAGVKAIYDVRADPQSHQVNVLIRFEKAS